MQNAHDENGIYLHIPQDEAKDETCNIPRFLVVAHMQGIPRYFLYSSSLKLT